MKSLAERHADRAQRKADGLAFSDNMKGDVGLAALRVSEAQAAIAGLTEEQREELKTLIPDDGFKAEVDAYGDAYDSRGSLKSAGIGVTNTLVAPVAFANATEGTTGPLGGMDGNGDGQAGDGFTGAPAATGWGTLPEPSITPEQGNANGAAVAETAAKAGAEGANDAEGSKTPAKGAKTAGKATGEGATA